MVVDDDDLVSRRLAAHAAAHPGAHGWYLDDGLELYHERHGDLVRPLRSFWRVCGSCSIVRTALLDLPERAEAASDFLVRRLLGSHLSLKPHLEAQGTPLAPLPFPGAVYRREHAGAHSLGIDGQPGRRGPGILRQQVFNRGLLTSPRRNLGALARIRPVTAGFRREFMG